MALLQRVYSTSSDTLNPSRHRCDNRHQLNDIGALGPFNNRVRYGCCQGLRPMTDTKKDGRGMNVMCDVDLLAGRELDAAVQREAMGGVIGWILMPSGEREPVFVTQPGTPPSQFPVQPMWVPRYSTDPAQAAAIDKRMHTLRLVDWYERNLPGIGAKPADRCRAALIAVRAARAIQRLTRMAS